jgi:Putative zinc-finger
MTSRKAATKALTNRTCKEITDLIFGYLTNTLSRSVTQDFQRHLRVCPDCVNFLNTYKKTLTTSRSLRPEEIPTNVRDNIVDFLRKRIRKSALRS